MHKCWAFDSATEFFPRRESILNSQKKEDPSHL